MERIMSAIKKKYSSNENESNKLKTIKETNQFKEGINPINKKEYNLPKVKV